MKGIVNKAGNWALQGNIELLNEVCGTVSGISPTSHKEDLGEVAEEATGTVDEADFEQAFEEYIDTGECL